jgi:hypothetical protein
MLTAIANNRYWQQLYLKFRSGDILLERVAGERREGLPAADSKGTHMRHRILNHYAYRRIHAAA